MTKVEWAAEFEAATGKRFVNMAGYYSPYKKFDLELEYIDFKLCDHQFAYFDMPNRTFYSRATLDAAIAAVVKGEESK